MARPSTALVRALDRPALPPLSIDAHLEAQVLGLPHPEVIAQQLAAGSGRHAADKQHVGRKANGSADYQTPQILVTSSPGGSSSS